MNTSRRLLKKPVWWAIIILLVPLAIHISHTLTFVDSSIPNTSATGAFPYSAFTDPASEITVLTWNVLYGSEEGERSNNWGDRKVAFAEILKDHVNLDILCIQEALENQVRYFDHLLPFHHYIGVGRDDGRHGGEHCPIYFHNQRFELLECDTFWLSDTPDVPSLTWGNKLPRICTWARLRRINSGQVFRVFNTHFPLNGHARKKSARLIAERISVSNPNEPIVFAGDLNCGPRSRPRIILSSAGLNNTDPNNNATFHFFGFGLVNLDAIMVGSRWLVKDIRIARDKAPSGYPSDHFGVIAKLGLKLPQT